LKLKDDPWLTDYINAIHFAIRYIETQSNDLDALFLLRQETDVLVQEAILGNIPMEILTIRRLSRRIRSAEQHLLHNSPENKKFSSPLMLKNRKGDSRELLSDFRFICQAYIKFSRKGIAEECDLYLPKIYPDIKDMDAIAGELIEIETASGRVVEISEGLYCHSFENTEINR
jgi:hypothetical protein